MSPLVEFIRDCAPEYGIYPEHAVRHWEAAGRCDVMPLRADQLAELQGWGMIVDPENARQSVRGAFMLVRVLRRHYAGDLRKTYAAFLWGRDDIDTVVRLFAKQWETRLPLCVREYVAWIVGPLDGHAEVVAIPHRPGAIVVDGLEVIPKKAA